MTVREHLVVAHRVRQKRDRSLVRDLLGFGARPSPGEHEAVDEILSLLDLSAIADQPVVLLPLGTGRIVEVARALASEPKIVLLDEPTSGLDAHETHQVADALRTALADRGVAFVVVEHDVELVLEISSQITVLDFGRVIARGVPSDIRASAEVQAAYLGSTTAEAGDGSS
jgi:branched-chain amino acid transport system ATP-binding protein